MMLGQRRIMWMALLAARGESRHTASLGLAAAGFVGETRSTASTTSFRRLGLLMGLAVAVAACGWNDPRPGNAAAEPAKTVSEPHERPEAVADPQRLARSTVAGTIRDAQGQAVAGAQVCTNTPSERVTSSERRKFHCTLSGSDGDYRIEGLLAVRHTVTAGAPGFVPGPYFRGEGARRREAVELRAGQDLRALDITLQSGGVEIHGVVKDMEGRPIGGARVKNFGRSGQGYAQTDANGLFSMWVKPDLMAVWAQADGHVDHANMGVAPGHRFELFLTPESALVGRVVWATNGTPVEGARVISS